MKRRIASLVTAILMCLMLVPTVAVAAESGTVFTDVSEAHWARESIVSAYNKGLIHGISNNLFDPENTLTYAQVAQIVFNTYGGNGLTDEAVEIEDVPADAWYAEPVMWLLQYDLAELRDGKFYPNDPAPRWFLADVLYRTAKAMSVKLPKAAEAVVFPDMTGDYAKYAEAVTALQQVGIISGFQDGGYGPEQMLTRCQMAKVIDLYTDIAGLEPGANMPVPKSTPTVPSTPEPSKTPEPTPSPSPAPDPAAPSGSNVWWSDSTYREILDYAATKDGVVTHTYETSGNVIIYVAAKWPVMRHYRLTFSSAGSSYTLFRWTPEDNAFYDFSGVMELKPEDPMSMVDKMDSNYYYYKDREPWASTSPDTKFPWE